MASKSDKELIYRCRAARMTNGAAPEGEELLPALDDMTPREIVAELDKYIVGPECGQARCGGGACAIACAGRNFRRKSPKIFCPRIF